MLKEGTILDGKYEILKKIGEGGMSIVYLARNNRLNMQLAVKEIKNDGTKSTKVLLKGLEREANILKDVDHPVIPRIIDIVKYENTICVVMDFIEGTNLLDEIREKGPVPQDTAVEWSKELAGALSYLHHMKPPIIYRDMKPANIMVRPDHHVKLIDFGTAKEYDEESIADTTALGTRAYAAPEQFGYADGRGKFKTDERTDIYNLGATMYHMVTGKMPRNGNNRIPRIREVNPALSSGLESVIARCMEDKPEDRYQSCEELLYALDHYNELDESYKKKNRKKVGLFLASAALTVIFAVTSGIGRSGQIRAERNNYNNLIQSGNEAKQSGDYGTAEKDYKAAAALRPHDSDAYSRYLQMVTEKASDAGNDSDDSTKDRNESISDDLTYIVTRYNKGDITAEENPNVVYTLGLTYFTELQDYSSAETYFSAVSKVENTYQGQAEDYAAISQIMSEAAPDMDRLLGRVDSFADSVSAESTLDETHFDNCLAIGQIYSRYLSTEDVPDRAIAFLEKVLDQLDGYTAKSESGKDSAYYAYIFDDELSEAYRTAAEENGNESDFDQARTFCGDVRDLAVGELSEAGLSLSSADVSGNAENYISKYVTKTIEIAQMYQEQGDAAKKEKNAAAANAFYNSAKKTLQDAEQQMGNGTPRAAKIYSAHLSLLFDIDEAKDQNPQNWDDTMREELLTVYNEGGKVPDISRDANWKKRISVMDSIKTGRIDDTGGSEVGGVSVDEDENAAGSSRPDAENDGEGE